MGHVLLEGHPGTGKTLLEKSLSRLLGRDFKRIQFTTDLLPSDILGAQIFNPQANDFTFVQGPIFTDVLLADEINRAPARTQSALLEAMEEKQVSIEGKRFALSPHFCSQEAQGGIRVVHAAIVAVGVAVGQCVWPRPAVAGSAQEVSL